MQVSTRKIRELSSQYGFSHKVHKNSKNGEKLLTIKTQRNNLAHGTFSFSEIGRNYSINQLKDIKHEAILYLRGILKNIKRYLDNENFKR